MKTRHKRTFFAFTFCSFFLMPMGVDAGVGDRCMVHFQINFCCVQGQVTYGDGSACKGGSRAICAFYARTRR